MSSSCFHCAALTLPYVYHACWRASCLAVFCSQAANANHRNTADGDRTFQFIQLARRPPTSTTAGTRMSSLWEKHSWVHTNQYFKQRNAKLNNHLQGPFREPLSRRVKLGHQQHDYQTISSEGLKAAECSAECAATMAWKRLLIHPLLQFLPRVQTENKGQRHTCHQIQVLKVCYQTLDYVKYGYVSRTLLQNKLAHCTQLPTHIGALKNNFSQELSHCWSWPSTTVPSSMSCRAPQLTSFRCLVNAWDPRPSGRHQSAAQTTKQSWSVVSL
jgi:hypothetical protein